MKLTPIRVRGKKMPRTADADNGAGSASPGAASRSASRSSSQRAAARTRSKPPYVSFDQRLPLEIIERIYVLSENFHLAVCNRRLHEMLSRRSTRLLLAVAAFSPAWEVSWIYGKNPPLEKDPESIKDEAGFDEYPGNPVFQSALLACSWVDMALLLDAEQLWMRQVVRRSGEDEVSRWHAVMRRSTRTVADQAQELGLDLKQARAIVEAHAARGCGNNWLHNRLDNPADKAGGNRFQAAPPVYDTHVCFTYEALNAAFNLSYWPTRDEDAALDDGHMFGRCLQPLLPMNVMRRYVHPRTRIPERLFLADGAAAVVAAAGDGEGCSPEATEAAQASGLARLQDSFKLLLWLVLGSARLQPADSWEVTVEGFRRLMQVAMLPGISKTASLPLPSSDTRSSDASALPLDLPPDVLATCMFGLFNQLLVCKKQWPDAVLSEQEVWIDRLTDNGRLFQGSRARLYFSAICLTLKNELAAQEAARNGGVS